MTTYTTACGKRVVYVHHSCLLLPTADIELLCTYNWCVCVCMRKSRDGTCPSAPRLAAPTKILYKNLIKIKFISKIF